MKQPLSRQARGLTLGLVLQYILGIIANLYAKFPDTTNRGDLWHAAWSNGIVAAHIILGLLMTLSSLIFLVRALRRNDKTWRWVAIIGFIAIWAAAFGGSQFVATQNDAYSLLMALGFLVAIVVYGWSAFGLKSQKA